MMIDIILFLLGVLVTLFVIVWVSVMFGRKKEFVTVNGMARVIPVFYVPKWWIFWPKGRSMSLWLPIIGKFAAIHPSDAETALLKKLVLRHEYIHFERQGRHPLLWIAKYLVFPSFRFQEEVAAFRESIVVRKEQGVEILILDGNQVEVAAFYANTISSSYFLPSKYDFFTAYFELLRG